MLVNDISTLAPVPERGAEGVLAWLGTEFGDVTLLIDGKPAGELKDIKTAAPAGNGFLFGRNTGTPVSHRYEPPFALTGGLDKLTIETAPNVPWALQPLVVGLARVDRQPRSATEPHPGIRLSFGIPNSVSCERLATRHRRDIPCLP